MSERGLPTSGPLTFSMILAELERPGPLSFNDADARALCGIPSGVVKLSDFYGKRKYVAPPPVEPPPVEQPPVANMRIFITDSWTYDATPAEARAVVFDNIGAVSYQWIVHYTNGPFIQNLYTDVISMIQGGTITVSCKATD